ncbi:hypothetical protein HPP92_006321 [Vanilla planifolia]|uniref:Uncharacterized protein n=1 Tax=Vanilla planifolia TaxID=51239 RepID=A0A835V9I6_VANPL|nr:hypothetical protein HPP92_006321 [Vanilla planifolia]
MVGIHVTVEGVEEQQFLYECSCGSSVDDVADAIIEIYNLQARIQSICFSIRQRLFTDAFRETCPDLVFSLDRKLSEAEAYSSKEQVLYQKFLSPHILQDHIQTIEREIEVAHSRGLPDSNIPLIISSLELNRDVQLMWAGKELLRGKKMCEYVGENEKTKIIVKLKLGCKDLQKRDALVQVC